MQLGTPVSMGRARWTTDGASIFSGEGRGAGLGRVRCCHSAGAGTGFGPGGALQAGAEGRPDASQPAAAHIRLPGAAALVASPVPPRPGPAPAAVADGKRLASEPAPSATYYENIRARKIQRAALEGPTLAGYRCGGGGGSDTASIARPRCAVAGCACQWRAQSAAGRLPCSHSAHAPLTVQGALARSPKPADPPS